MIESALPQADDDVTQQIGQHRPINYIKPNTALPLLRSDEGDLSRAVERAWSLLLASNRTPWLFRYAGIPTWVVPDDEGRPVATPLSDERLRHMLARLAIWRRINRQGDLVPAHPPMPLVKSVLATPDPGLPVLVGIVNTPVFGRNGKLLTAAGYHPDARLLIPRRPASRCPRSRSAHRRNRSQPPGRSSAMTFWATFLSSRRPNTRMPLRFCCSDSSGR